MGDLLLHPLKSELNFPIGEKTKLPESPRRWTLPMHLLDAIFYGTTNRISVPDFKPNSGTLDLLKEIQLVIQKGEKEYAVQANPHPILLNHNYYNKEIRNLMGQWAYVWLREQDEIKMGITHTTRTSRSGTSSAQSAAFMRKVSETNSTDQINQSNQINQTISSPKRLRGRSANNQNEKKETKEKKNEKDDGEKRSNENSRPLLRSISGPAGPDGKGYDVSSVEIHLMNYLTCSFSSLERKQSEEMISHYFSSTAIQLLNLSRDWIYTFLPHVLSKVHRVSFGLLRENDRDRWKNQIIAAAGGDVKAAENFYIAKSRWSLSVPFIGKDVPSRAAEFAHPDVLLGLSILAFRYNGLRTSDLKLVINELRRNMLNEPGPFSERTTRILFEEWKDLAYEQWELKRNKKKQKQELEKEEQEDQDQEDQEDENENENENEEAPPELLPLELLQVDDPIQLKNVNRLLSHVPETVLFYLDKLVFPSVMEHRTTKLQASGVDLGSDMIFGTRLGFSGTPSDLLPRELRPCHYEQGSEAEIIRVLTSTKHVEFELIEIGWSVNSLLKNIAGGNNNNNNNNNNKTM